jgi:peptidoglycan/LPS O-acetylase OafA/YrhL
MSEETAGESENNEEYPPAARSVVRAEIVWWVLFVAPLIVVGSVLVAGLATDRSGAIWAFVLSVWAVVAMAAMAFRPTAPTRSYWIGSIVLSFAAALATLALATLTARATDALSPTQSIPATATTNPAPTTSLQP